MDTFRAIIGLWPSHAVLAADLGISVNTVSGMARRDFIHARHWLALEAAAKRRGYPVTAEKLGRIAATVTPVGHVASSPKGKVRRERTERKGQQGQEAEEAA